MLIKLLEFWAQRSHVEIITGHGDGDSVYLVRYHLINNRFFKLYLHYFLRSDLDDPHDHPWSSISLGIQNEYTEEIYDWRTRKFTALRRRPGGLIFRPAKLVHRIKVDNPTIMDMAGNWRKAPTTLFFAFTKSQEWGFVEHSSMAPRWKFWKDYLADHYGRKAE